MKKKTINFTSVDKTINSTWPEIPVEFEKIQLLGTDYNLGRQDLDNAFKKVAETINEIIKKL